MTYSQQDFTPGWRERMNEKRQRFMSETLAGFMFGVGLCALTMLAFIVVTD